MSGDYENKFTILAAKERFFIDLSGHNQVVNAIKQYGFLIVKIV